MLIPGEISSDKLTPQTHKKHPNGDAITPTHISTFLCHPVKETFTSGGKPSERMEIIRKIQPTSVHDRMCFKINKFVMDCLRSYVMERRQIRS